MAAQRGANASGAKGDRTLVLSLLRKGLNSSETKLAPKDLLKDKRFKREYPDREIERGWSIGGIRKWGNTIMSGE